MLMEYFTYEELKDIKKQVIAQHCSQQQWDCAAEMLKGFSLWSQAEELQKAFKYADHEKTDYGESVRFEMFHYFSAVVLTDDSTLPNWKLPFLALPVPLPDKPVPSFILCHNTC